MKIDLLQEARDSAAALRHVAHLVDIGELYHVEIRVDMIVESGGPGNGLELSFRAAAVRPLSITPAPQDYEDSEAELERITAERDWLARHGTTHAQPGHSLVETDFGDDIAEWRLSRACEAVKEAKQA